MSFKIFWRLWIWIFSKCYTWKCQIYSNIQNSELHIWAKWQFLGLQNDQNWFHARFGLEKNRKFPHCVFSFRLSRSVHLWTILISSERIWARAKWMVRRENTSGNINKVKALTEKALASIDSNYWKKAYGIFTKYFIFIYLVLQEIPIIASELKSHLFTTQRQPHLQSHLVEEYIYVWKLPPHLGMYS